MCFFVAVFMLLHLATYRYASECITILQDSQASVLFIPADAADDTGASCSIFILTTDCIIMGVQIKFLVHLKKTLKEHMLGKEYAAT
jgi:hypothetical protein